MLLMDAIQWEILRAFTHPSFQQYCEGAVAEYDAKNSGSKMCDKKCRTCVLRVLAIVRVGLALAMAELASASTVS